MPDIAPGDHVTVTHPIQPGGHAGGETGTVVETRDDLVLIQDRDGTRFIAYKHELNKD